MKPSSDEQDRQHKVSSRKPRAIPRVLIVEDSPETRYVYVRYLERSGYEYETVCVDTVAEATAQLASQRFDCILLDFCLPDADGLELLGELSDGHGNCPMPVVMITGHGDESVAVEAMKLGAKDYLVKDRISADGLISALEYAIEKARSEREEHRYREELEHASVTDPLTGLHNRRYLFEHLSRELRRATRYQTPLCLLLIDLDHFKQVNDTHGHVVGDNVLMAFGEMLVAVARGSDIVARYGGEEFCAVLTNTDLEGGLHFAERICAEARRLRYDDGTGKQFSVTCSVGLAPSHAGDVSAEVLLRKSDIALYDAKRDGRDRVCMYAAEQSVSA